MGEYQFVGTYRDAQWTNLPSPEEVRESLRRAIKGANPEVFEIRIDQVDVTASGTRLPSYMPAGWPTAEVVVVWQTHE